MPQSTDPSGIKCIRSIGPTQLAAPRAQRLMVGRGQSPQGTARPRWCQAAENWHEIFTTNGQPGVLKQVECTHSNLSFGSTPPPSPPRSTQQRKRCWTVLLPPTKGPGNNHNDSTTPSGHSGRNGLQCGPMSDGTGALITAPRRSPRTLYSA